MTRKRPVPRTRPEARTRPEEQPVPPGMRLYQVRIDVLADPADIHALTERLVHALCPDATHPGPCANPWAMSTIDAGSYRRGVRRRILEGIAMTNPPPR